MTAKRKKFIWEGKLNPEIESGVKLLKQLKFGSKEDQFKDLEKKVKAKKRDRDFDVKLKTLKKQERERKVGRIKNILGLE